MRRRGQLGVGPEPIRLGRPRQRPSTPPPVDYSLLENAPGPELPIGYRSVMPPPSGKRTTYHGATGKRVLA